MLLKLNFRTMKFNYFKDLFFVIEKLAFKVECKVIQKPKSSTKYITINFSKSNFDSSHNKIIDVVFLNRIHTKY